ncbi:hypothetical protein CSB45_02920 [candidate division KSB3 bacterium]|uniref:Uncharacterized protein n=1 Tax=candidate division KSB3 bacterium TaxID=2044937 RepID=A0A2G6E8V6_9BACT|nr:MAG: hypothetical protein CSB45_02920 [candidate division KSB3 bacterium]PIE29009.1 MAG: hypothetical protein CSA57_11160 [candidate division KSB3 bacterium]
MTILPEPVRFTSQEYERFLDNYPHVERALSDPFISEEGETIPLIKHVNEGVLIYLDLLSCEQEKELGAAALRELNKRLLSERNYHPKIHIAILGITLATMIAIGWRLFFLQDVREPPLATPTAIPTPVHTSAPPRPVPTLRPTFSPIPTAKPIPTFTPKPRSTPTVKATPKPLYISGVYVQDANKNFVPELDGKYLVKPLEVLTLEVQLEHSEHREFSIEYTPMYGTLQAPSRYIAPNKPGEFDLIVVKVSDAESGLLLAQESVKIKIIDSY